MGTPACQGDDPGYHLPGSAVWAVHGDMPTIVAGIRALLMQALHPGALAGVHDHSRFHDDPLGRLAGTIRWIFTVTYGSTGAARAASAGCTGSTNRFAETTWTATASPADYAANDPELLRWVHIAFTDAFLSAHKMWGRPIPGGPDAYVREWAQAGRLMGVDPPAAQRGGNAPATGPLVRRRRAPQRRRVAETVAFIRDPPLHPSCGRAIACCSLPP